MVTLYMCDDNKVLLEKFTAEIKKISEKNGLKISLRSFESGEGLIFELSDNPNSADVIFLDVLMGGINGIEVAKELRRLGCFAEIVFLTSSEEYVFDSFDTNPFYYLLKNEASMQKLESILLKVYDIADNKAKKVFHCENKGEAKLIPYDSISYFEVDNRVITVHFDNAQVFSFYSTMDALCAEFSEEDFVRVHRSFLVNIKYIKNIGKDMLELTNGDTVPMSASNNKKTRMAIMKYHSR